MAKTTKTYIAVFLFPLFGLVISAYTRFAHCHDVSHQTSHEVNPICSKCGGRDGVMIHKCTNPDGNDVFCHCCGKRLSRSAIIDDIRRHISKYNSSLVLLDSRVEDSGTTVCTYQTGDERQIVFEVTGYLSKQTMTPFGFYVPIKEEIIIDNFYEMICTYVSQNHGTICVDNMSTQEMINPILKVWDIAELLLEEYGIKHRRPGITCSIIKNGETHVFSLRTDNEVILHDNLIKLFFQ